MASMKSKTIIAFAIVYLVWGSTYLAIRVGVETIPPFLLAGIRNLLAGVLLLAFARLRAQKSTASAPQRPSAPYWRTAFIMGFLMFALGNAILSWAETRIDSGLAALIVGAIPLWVVILARVNPFGPRRAITLQKFLGVAVGIGGLALLVWPGASSAGVHFDLLAIGFLLIGSLGWAVGTVVAPSLAHPADKLEGSGMTMVAGGAMILVVATVRGEWGALHPEAISGRSLAALAYLMVFGSMIAYSAYAYLMISCEASTVATYALVNPIVAVFLGWLVLGEVVTSRMLLATIVIIAGLGLTLFGGEVAGWTGRQLDRVTGRQGGRGTGRQGDRETVGQMRERA
jgi:drug/metabolite transporter (DMT)-like permease